MTPWWVEAPPNLIWCVWVLLLDQLAVGIVILWLIRRVRRDIEDATIEMLDARTELEAVRRELATVLRLLTQTSNRSGAA